MALWEKGSLNEVVIDGILSEVKLQENTDKNGNPVIYGEYKVRTTNKIDGIEYHRFPRARFAGKYVYHFTIFNYNVCWNSSSSNVDQFL